MTIIKKCLVLSLFICIGSTFQAGVDLEKLSEQGRQAVKGLTSDRKKRRGNVTKDQFIKAEFPNNLTCHVSLRNPSNPGKPYEAKLVFPQPEDKAIFMGDLVRRLVKEGFIQEPGFGFEPINSDKNSDMLQKAARVLGEIGEENHGLQIFRVNIADSPIISVKKKVGNDYYFKCEQKTEDTDVYFVAGEFDAISHFMYRGMVHDVSAKDITVHSVYKSLPQIIEEMFVTASSLCDIFQNSFGELQDLYYAAKYGTPNFPDRVPASLNSVLSLKEVLGEGFDHTTITAVKQSPDNKFHVGVRNDHGVLVLEFNYPIVAPELREALQKMHFKLHRSFDSAVAALMHILDEANKRSQLAERSDSYNEKRQNERANSYFILGMVGAKLREIPSSRQ